MHDIYIGIDPDVDGSGVGILSKVQKTIRVETMSLPDLIRYLNQVKAINWGSEDLPVVVVEAGYLNKTNWHASAIAWRKTRNPINVAAETGRRTGRNHQIAMDIVSIVKDVIGLPVVERRPLVKGWSGPDRKITHDEFVAVTGCQQKRTNQDQRDAGLLAWYESGLPIRLKIGQKGQKAE
jgi:hypothetical protein bfra3_11751|nr:MAG TPA: crossover junction endodeoxyribonuclease [Caudoviricetes sp.]